MNQIAISFLWLIGFFLVGSQKINAQGKLVQNCKFRNFNIADGLNHQVVRDIVQDKNGFIWIATPNGLNRFDGYSFKNYFNEPDNPNSLGNNNIFEIEADQAGNLWIATLRGGLDVFSPLDNQFYHYKNLPQDSASILSDEIVSLYFSSDQRVLGGTRFGIFDTSIAAGDSKTFNGYPLADDSTLLKYVYDIVEMADRQFWFASRDGLFFTNPDFSTIQKVFPADAHAYDRFYRFLKIDNQTLWVSFNAGRIMDLSALLQSPSSKTMIDLTDSLGLSGNVEIQDILLTSQDLWIATSNGLYQYPGFQKGKPFPMPVIHKKGDAPMSLSNSNITCLFEDREKNIWIGTGDGLNLYHKDYQFFKHLTFIPDDAADQPVEDFRYFLIDKNEHLWTCTNFGVHVFRNIAGQWTEIKRIPIGDFNAKEAIQITEYPDGSLWLAAYGSLSRIDHVDYDRFSIKSYYYNKGVATTFSTETLTQIKVAPDQKIYLSAYYGLCSFDPQSEIFTVYPAPEQMYLTDLVYDPWRKYWYAGSQLGILILDPRKTKLEYLLTDEGQKVFENDRVKAMVLEGDSLLWIGGGNGLHKINLKTKARKTYHLNDGLRDVFISNLFQDTQNNIWMTNSQGIDVLNRKSGRFMHFGLEDGLQGTSYTTRSTFVEPSGQAWLAGKQGINSFQPDQLYAIAPAIKGRFTGITINNLEGATVAAEKLFTDADMAPFAVEKLKLNHRDPWLALSYSALHFTHPEKIVYEYRLNPDDENWNQMLPQQQITYTNLPSGTHELFIRYKINHEKIWEEKVLTIIKKPAPWKSTGAYLVYALTLGLLVWAWIKNRENRIKRENALIEAERESFRKRSARDFHDEAGHHITKISILSELIYRDAESHAQLHQYATQISATTQKLREGMRDFIWVLDPDKDNLYNTVAKIRETGDQLFEYRDTTFQCPPYQESWKQINLSSEQRRHLLFIFKEAMNNILKHAQAKNVAFDIRQENKKLVLSLRDDGIGFEQKTEKNGYGLKNMQARAQKIQAEFRLVSSPQNGSEISISLSTAN